MSETTDVKSDAVPDLDDLLQCPVCYEIPSGQIFQCNEGHHVCGKCKVRLDVCPVCRALFFGTRNYAMEELISNMKKLQAFKLGGKVTTASGSSKSSTATKEAVSEQAVSTPAAADSQEGESHLQLLNPPTPRPPKACKGLFRCLCCKSGNTQRLPLGRLLNHLRYFHSPELIEGLSENGEYVQAWQFSTVPGKIVTAVRVSDMGIFYLTIEVNKDLVCAWLTMAVSPWVAHDFCYTVTISGNDREAIFSDCVWSVRSCEGYLKKRGRCLIVEGADARSMTTPALISGKLSVRRAPPDQIAQQAQPRAVMRVATRGNERQAGRVNERESARDNEQNGARASPTPDLEPFLQGLQNDVARLSRAFATLGRETTALLRSEDELRARVDRQNRAPADYTSNVAPEPQTVQNNQSDNTEPAQLSRNARRRMRLRMRAALNLAETSPAPNTSSARQTNSSVVPARRQTPTPSDRVIHFSGLAVVQQAPVAPQPVANNAPSGSSNGHAQNGNQVRNSKKKRRQRS